MRVTLAPMIALRCSGKGKKVSQGQQKHLVCQSDGSLGLVKGGSKTAKQIKAKQRSELAKARFLTA